MRGHFHKFLDWCHDRFIDLQELVKADPLPWVVASLLLGFLVVFGLLG